MAIKFAVLTVYGLVALFALLVFVAFSKTAISTDVLPGLDVIFVFVVNPATFLTFMCLAIYRQIKLIRISLGLFGQIFFCGFLLQLSLDRKSVV